MIEETNIEGLLLIDKKNFKDLRGQLIKPYSTSFFRETKFDINFKEVWFTKSKKNVIRAMHLQMGEYPCKKMVSAISGKILDVIIDLREGSKTFKEVYSVELSGDDEKSLYIPVGCAHGYKVLEENTVIMYMATEEHSAKDDIGIHWSSFGFNWEIENPILSPRDVDLPTLEEYLKVNG